MKKRPMLILGILVISLFLVSCGRFQAGKAAGEGTLRVTLSQNAASTPTMLVIDIITSPDAQTCITDREGASITGTGASQTLTENYLIPNTAYSYTVSCSDSSGNTGSATGTFSTAGGGSGGAGGGGGAAPGGGGGVAAPFEYEDAWLVGTSAKNLEMANTNAAAGIVTGENLYDILTYVSKDELDALADGTYKTGESEYSYQQYLYFDKADTNTNELVKFAESDEDVSDVFFFVDSGFNMGKFKLEFSAAAESDVYSTAGAADTTGPVLQDFEDTKLKMLGQEYSIVLARRVGTNYEDGIKLTMMGGAVQGRLDEGEEEMYNMGVKEYTVKLTYVDATYAEFDVNGEITKTLQVGEIYRLTDGTQIGVSKIFYQNYVGGIHRADFFLGSEKIVLRDDDVTNTEADHELEVNGEMIDGADVIITGTDDNTTFKINTIEVNMTAQDDYFVGIGDTLSNAIASAGDDKELLFTNNWDIGFDGLTDEITHDIKLNSSIDRKYQLIWYDGGGNQVEMPLAYAYDNTQIILSEELTEKALILKESIPIKKNDYFVVTGGNIEEGTAKSFALQYKGADKVSATNAKIKFRNLGNWTTLEYFINTSDTNDVCEIMLGNYTFKVENATTKTQKDFDIFVDLDTTYKDDIYKDTVAELPGTLLEGETRTYEISGASYGVSLVYVDSTYVKFRVNGELTAKLQEGEHYILNDGSVIEVLNILYQSYAGGIHSADFKLIEDPVIEGYDHLGIGEEQTKIIDSYGAQIDLELGNYDYSGPLDSVDLTITTPNPDDYENVEPSELKLTIDATAVNNVTVSSFKIDGISHSLLTPEGETNIAYGYTSMGGKITLESPISAPHIFTYNYPEKQRFAQVYVLSEVVEEFEEEICEPSWILEESWSECGNGVQYKHYYDTNNCNQPESQPAPISQPCDSGLGGYVCPAYSEGIVIHKINLTKQYAVPDNTYENGWEFNFFLTVPEDESVISMWISDWVNDDTGDILQTDGNVEIRDVCWGGDGSGEPLYECFEESIPVGSNRNYSGSGSFVGIDKYPSCQGRQVKFRVLVKLPEGTPYGYYSTSYGVRSLPLEIGEGEEAVPEEPVVEDFVQETWASINAGETVIVELENDEMGITNVSLTVGEKAYGAWMKIEKLSGLPSSVKSFNREVYKNIMISERNLLEVMQDTATIKFKVAKSWLTEHGLSQNDVALSRYKDNSWMELTTLVLSDDRMFVYYSAETPGFGYFVIGKRAE